MSKAVLIIAIILASCVSSPPEPAPPPPIIMEDGVHALNYLPFVASGPKTPDIDPPICSANARAERLGNLLRWDPRQQRPTLLCHPALAMVAQRRAADMFNRQYFGHCDPDGRCPNWHVEKAGYQLPDHYTENGNNVESIAANQTDPDEAWSALLRSSSHRAHLLGEIDFFRMQDCYGIGYADHINRRSPFEILRVYVIITAPCMWSMG